MMSDPHIKGREGSSTPAYDTARGSNLERTPRVLSDTNDSYPTRESLHDRAALRIDSAPDTPGAQPPAPHADD